MFLTPSSSFLRPAPDSTKQYGIDIDENDLGPLKPHRAQQLLLQHRFQDGAIDSRSKSSGGASSNENSRHDRSRSNSPSPLKQHQDQQILLKQQFLQSFIPKNSKQQKQTSKTNSMSLTSSSTHSAPGRMFDSGRSSKRRGSLDSTASTSTIMTETSVGNNSDISTTQRDQGKQQQQKRSHQPLSSCSDHGCRSNVGITSKNTNNNNNNSDYKLKIANEVLLGSIAAVIDFLKVAGVSPARYVNIIRCLPEVCPASQFFQPLTHSLIHIVVS